MPLILLDRFKAIFENKRYRHRDSTQGDVVARALPEDLYELGASTELVGRIKSGKRVTNTENIRRMITSRRGDGSFGEIIPGSSPIFDAGHSVAVGKVATIEIGTEVKILQKAMIKQIDRVIGDLKHQVTHFRKGGDDPICIAIVAINYAEFVVSVEGEREWRTDGKAHRHPIQEAAEARRRIENEVSRHYNELLFLPYKATNTEPYNFGWLDENSTRLDYAAVLTRVARMYDRRFSK